MQLTIEIPDGLAERLESDGSEIAQVIERGLAGSSSARSALAQEIIEFLGRGPSALEIVSFRPSAESIERTADLLERNRESTLSPEERAEIEEICAWNRVFALIKAQARSNLPVAA